MKKWSFLVMAAAISIVLAACSMEPGFPTKDKSSKVAPKETSEHSIGLSISTLNNPFFVTLSDSAEEKAKENGVKITVSDAQDDASKQASDVENLIQKGVDLIIINPVDSSSVATAVESANAANIPVITVDRTSDGGDVVAHIASDNVAGGELAGEYLMTLIEEGSEVAMLEGVAGSSAANDRGQGFLNIVDDKVKLVASQTANFNRTEGLTVMENILQANPNVKAVFAQNDEMALGALEAITAARKDVIIIGFDATDDAVAKVKAGTLAATVAQQPTLIGEKAIEAAIKILAGETVDANIPVDLELIKK
ncbi:ribose ABC transporter substrate-binding protein RbsB [Lysinibacillus sp. 2017]|uniref:ribose ABC transporter substrate-binding protein RbsB n=1 Tax=unclassified Lysinibacillus TaxID=2636778 RepID=UPI000D525910|nr:MULTISPECIES: ribose ABC transporter substrate-binding protein RbsB [unclassified Lysinibacillus]AWE07085.1 ribose ABC transporter substrate-binding protein RbsB [Lysinibacillus sp. 2017]TGN36995.1 ribose ABC transporter substrate-binding protein RbsB [Lysinibacillus sp. S2017]